MRQIYELRARGVDPSTEWEFLFGGENQYHATEESAQSAVQRLADSATEAFAEYPGLAARIAYYYEPVTRQDFHADRLGLIDWREAQALTLCADPWRRRDVRERADQYRVGK